MRNIQLNEYVFIFVLTLLSIKANFEYLPAFRRTVMGWPL
ncbi:hypothetical protein PPEP_a1118 [Pseudoalteromonas peptidolytica F12-50-A1]|uniref:Uncharacterized protein n=1 Tax=Pseudoalteromonas peptidolytica F12-50-A1 TaxID=1315280 RepID=A0A8I0MVC9_9GAMM|nr:hypothetical protein [Pseudoalteromonas peptidolytica F12-50-A1]